LLWFMIMSGCALFDDGECPSFSGFSAEGTTWEYTASTDRWIDELVLLDGGDVLVFSTILPLEGEASFNRVSTAETVYTCDREGLWLHEYTSTSDEEHSDFDRTTVSVLTYDPPRLVLPKVLEEGTVWDYEGDFVFKQTVTVTRDGAAEVTVPHDDTQPYTLTNEVTGWETVSVAAGDYDALALSFGGENPSYYAEGVGMIKREEFTELFAHDP